MQVILGGQKQHIFQSSLRATAKLHLLSPAIFPLPFAYKFAVPAERVSTAVPAATDTQTAHEASGRVRAADTGSNKPAVPAENSGPPVPAVADVQTADKAGGLAGAADTSSNRPAVPAEHVDPAVPAVAAIQTGDEARSATAAAAETAAKAPTAPVLKPAACIRLDHQAKQRLTDESKLMSAGPVTHLVGGAGKALAAAPSEAEVRSPGEA